MNFKCNGTTVNLVEFDKVYPIGSIYMNATNPNNPATYLGGGTWEQFGQGRTLIGVGTGDDGTDSQTFTANSTGGEYKHYHAVQVGYTIMYGAITNGIEPNAIRVAKLAEGGWAGAVKDPSYGSAPKINSGIESSFKNLNSDNYASALSSTGTTSKSSTVQPYITVYIWKRIA